MSEWHVRGAADAVGRGGIIAYPTEGVYGLGCDPMDRSAVYRILDLKRRSVSKGLIVIAAHIEQLKDYIVLPDPIVAARVESSWPGPITWVVPATKNVPFWLRGRDSGLAVRVTAHPVASAICWKTGPLVSTSANPAGCRPARDVCRVRAYFRNALDCIVPGRVGSQAGPTEIRDALSGRWVRASGPEIRNNY